MQDSTFDKPKEIPSGFLIIFNIQKKKNLGTLVRSAAAFNIKQIFFVDSGGKKLTLFGSQGTATQLLFRKFSTFKDIKAYCVEKKIDICGVEILEDGGSIRVDKHPFKRDTAFMLGNEGQGLNKTQLAACDYCVYVAQHTIKTASLNVAVAGSIVLHHFALWAGFEEAPILGQKFKQEEGEQAKAEGKKDHGMRVIEMEGTAEEGFREVSLEEIKARKKAAGAGEIQQQKGPADAAGEGKGGLENLFE